MHWIGLMTIVVLVEAISDIVAKEFSLYDKLWIGGIAMAGYIATNVFWLFALKAGVGLGRGAVLFSVGSSILGVISGFVLYKEQISTVQFIGVVLGIIASLLIFWGE